MNETFDIVLITITFYPAIDTSARLMYDLAEGLVKKGLKVLVITPNREYLNPSNVFSVDEEVTGIKVKRVEVPRLDKDEALQKLILYKTFSKKALKYTKTINKRLLLSLLPPLFVPYKVLNLSLKHKVPFLFIVYDLLPDAWINRKRLNPRNPLAIILKHQTKELLTKSDRVVVIGRDMKEYILEEYGISTNKVSVIQNWSRITDEAYSKKEEALNEKFTILYAGNMGEAQGLENVLDAAKKLQEVDSDIELLFVGNGRKKPELMAKAKQYELKNLVFKDYVKDDMLRNIMSKASALLVTLRKESKGMSVPSKLYYYMSAGKPILAIVPEKSETAISIEEDQLGIVCNQDSTDSITEGILKLKNDTSLWNQSASNTARAFREKYNNESAVDKYYEVIKELLKETE